MYQQISALALHLVKLITLLLSPVKQSVNSNLYS